MSYVGDPGYYVVAMCVKCGGTRFVNGVCQACVLQELREELERLKRHSVPFTTACDPDVGWGGD